jgi:hypothetical protein
LNPHRLAELIGVVLISLLASAATAAAVTLERSLYPPAWAARKSHCVENLSIFHGDPTFWSRWLHRLQRLLPGDRPAFRPVMPIGKVAVARGLGLRAVRVRAHVAKHEGLEDNLRRVRIRWRFCGTGGGRRVEYLAVH